MGILRDAIDAGSQQPPSADGTTANLSAQPPGAVGSAAGAGGQAELRRRRDALAEQVIELHWDLGGLAYEMAIRDHFRLDVLVRRAAVLQERDAELAEIERLLAMRESGAAGSCPQCSAPHSRGAVYCWQCGEALMERSPAAGAGSDASTAVMDALLAPGLSPERRTIGAEPEIDAGGADAAD